LYQRVAYKTQPRFFVGSFAEKPCAVVGGRGVPVVAAALAMKIVPTIAAGSWRLAGAVLGTEALRARPGF
jgi:hypothetical protein